MWQFIAGKIKQRLKQFMENLLEDEATSILKAEKYDRNSQRRGHRGGHYPRDMVTRYEVVESLPVPRVAGGPVDLQLFNKYERRPPDVDEAVLASNMAQ